MANHTPGPWHIRLNPDTDESLRAFADENYQISGQPNAAPWIAETFGGLREGVAEANAHLIARAPSMLALLERALPIIEREADARCDAMQQNGLTTDNSAYWIEMVELKREIQTEIDKVRGKEVKDV
jgi:hypothetical protein